MKRLYLLFGCKVFRFTLLYEVDAFPQGSFRHVLLLPSSLKQNKSPAEMLCPTNPLRPCSFGAGHLPPWGAVGWGSISSLRTLPGRRDFLRSTWLSVLRGSCQHSHD